MPLKRLAIAAAVAVAALSLAPASAAVTTIDKEYLPSNAAYGMCEIEPIVPTTDGPVWGVNIGAGCIAIPGNASEARIKSIVDTLSPSVGYYWVWLDEDWNEVGGASVTEDPEEYLLGGPDNHGFGCSTAGSSSNWLPKPNGAKYLYVHVDSAATGALDCGPGEGFATIGTISLQYR